MRRSAFTTKEAVIALALLPFTGLIVFVLIGGHVHRPGNAQRSSCQSNLKQMGLMIKQYVQDFDGKYPPVNLGQQGWVDIMMSYTTYPQIFQCPSDTTGAIMGTSDYFYNVRLSGQESRKLKYTENTITNGDGLGNAPTNFSLIKFPASWATDQNSPAWRHLDGANYVFADGHVKWFRPEKVTNEKANSSNFSFTPW